MKRIVADPKKCVACRACEMACALAHTDTDDIVEAIVEKGARPSIYVESAGAFVVPLQCRHCEDAPCMAVCPSAALVRPDEDGPVLVDQEKCIGCAFCVQACPFGLVRVARRPGTNGSDGKKKMVVVKCDHCAGRQAEGLGPACVESCPVGALAFVELDAVAKKARARAAADVAGEVITGARD